MVFPIKTEPIRITNTPGSCHLLQSAISAVSLSCFLLVFYISTLQFQIPNNRRKMTRQGAYKESDDMLIDEPKLPQQGQSQPFLMNKLFPHADLYRWMSYGNDGKHPACDSSYLGRRKFSYTLDNDIFVRYNTFNSAAELENSIKDNLNVLQPAHRNASAGDNVLTPVERELIFDIDMSDYDDVRYCCSGADVCLNCWPLMIVAVKVIDTSLRDDFGFRHILWVYSGRRGVHCWVCDRKARRLTNEQRAAVADYFRVYKENENNYKKVSLMGQVLHPFLARSYTEVLKEYFETKLLTSQNLLSSKERYEKILEMIPDQSIASELRGKWQESRRSSSAKEDINIVQWEQLKQLLQKHKCVEEIVFTYTYPRLDMEVSKHMNHLLKAPFCVHPKIGRVCVPINPNNCEEFDPTTVPTLIQLLEELNREGLRSDVEGGLFDTLTILRRNWKAPIMRNYSSRRICLVGSLTSMIGRVPFGSPFEFKWGQLILENM
ncbi:DNA primase small subunit [Arachis hypogaea]|nr:DNA primase small subunit [Arachis hypogaea]